jgi:hypothetical protein
MHGVFRGMIDESYDGGKLPRVFNLTCLVNSDAGWPYLEFDWIKVLEQKNEELRRQGRQQLSRFKASDCNNFEGEFKDWDSQERLEFYRELVGVLRNNTLHIHSWDMPLQLLVQEFPDTAPNPVGFAYIVLLGELMDQIGQLTLSLPHYRDQLISLHHDHCEYNGALAEHFGHLVSDDSFEYRHRYTSITPEQWQHCIPLQPVDLIAYENFKEGMRFHVKNSKEAKRNRMRASLEAIIDLDSICGRARAYTLDEIRGLKSRFETLDETTRQILFATARIKRP